MISTILFMSPVLPTSFKACLAIGLNTIDCSTILMELPKRLSSTAPRTKFHANSQRCWATRLLSAHSKDVDCLLEADNFPIRFD